MEAKFGTSVKSIKRKRLTSLEINFLEKQHDTKLFDHKKNEEILEQTEVGQVDQKPNRYKIMGTTCSKNEQLAIKNTAEL